MRRVVSILTNRLYLSALGVLVILVLCTSYLFAETLDRPLTSQPDEITVKLRAAGGLFEGSAATYRGVKVGKVTRIRLTDVGVEATVSMTSGRDVPSDTRAVVRSLSPVGEQYVDFQPSSDQGPYLADGDVIEATSTDVPLTLGSTVVAINKVLRQIDDDKLRTLLVEASTALEGTGGDLGSLVDDSALLLQELDDVYPETERLLRNGETVLDVAPDRRADLRELSTDARSLAGFLRDYDPELEQTISRAPGQIRQLRRLVADVRKVIPGFLDIGISVTDVFAAHDPHLRELLSIYSPGLQVLTDHVKDGKLQLALVASGDARCSYGTERRPPRTSDGEPLPLDLRCSASFSQLQRGAAHAPGPVGP